MGIQFLDLRQCDFQPELSKLQKNPKIALFDFILDIFEDFTVLAKNSLPLKSSTPNAHD